MKRTYVDYAADILTCFRETQEFTHGLDFEAFARDRKTINAVLRSLEVMGEAAKRIPEDVRKRHPGIPWKRIAGMRDKLIHQYSGVDLEIVWSVVREELPAQTAAGATLSRPGTGTLNCDSGARLRDLLVTGSVPQR